MKNKTLRAGLITASLMNIGGVLIFSRVFTNTAINEADPVVMSNFGLLMIIIWGLAYLSAVTINSNIKWLAAVFALEKLIYFTIWIRWLSANNLSSVYSSDIFAGIFYSIYGLNDFLFMLFFAWIFISQHRNNQK